MRSLIGLATAEERSFYWRLSCEKNMMFFCSALRAARPRRPGKNSRYFLKGGPDRHSHRRFSNISTGTSKAGRCARAASRPPILLLDEPTRSLDPLAAAEMRNLISSLEGVSVLLTSHNLSEIEELCGRVAVISRGELKAVDPPEGLRKQHAPVQTVKITVSGGDEDGLRKMAAGILSGISVERVKDEIILSFQRQPDDALLGQIVAGIAERGAVVTNIETEMPTLLDVLESYE